MKRIVALCMMLALVCGFASASLAADDTVRIGVFLPLTGQNAFGGQLELEGVQMAHKEVGEVLGKKSNCLWWTTNLTRLKQRTQSIV